ncbi:MAG: hypothetical protein KDA31_10225 [Phycisphaerales bacterium]|nr:hypothetical protein [Phycisphaerales bacterium]
MPRISSVLAAAAAASAFAAGAQISDPLITITASSSLGMGSASFTSADLGAITQPNGGIVFILFSPLTIVDQNNNNIIATITQLNVINNADNTDTASTPDALTSIGFGVFAGNADTTFNMTASLIGTGAVSNAALRATASVNVTDNNGNGATLTGLGAGGTYFNAAYNGGTTFADLVVGPLVAPAIGSNDSSQDSPAAPGVFSPIGVALNNMQAQFNFSLTAGDSAGGTSGFFSIPTPSSAALFGIAGFTAIRRRR